MPVTRLRTRRDARERVVLEGAVRYLHDGSDVAPALARAAVLVERELAATRGWGFVMVEPRLNAAVVAHLLEHSRRPRTAVRLWAELFALLPPDGNEVQADREALARVAGCTADHVTEIMGELEAIGAIYRRRDGRGVRYFVNPILGTHLAGAVRDRAQAEAPLLRLIEPTGR